MSSRTITSVVTADTIALNAAVFGYAGHSIVTPHQAIQQIWWTDERIEAKVTREFIVSKLRPNEREQLNRPVLFGEGLTDDTYLDWILRKAKRIYMILVECGVSDQIFGIVEDSWDDEDLPISRSEVDSLALSYKYDKELNGKFYNNQFRFLLRPLSEHAHINFAPNEVIPIEFVHRLPPAAALQSWSRLHLPKKPWEVFMRRKLSLGEKDEINPVLEDKFLADIATSRSIQHEHIASVWASWTSKDCGFWMTTFVAEHNLKSFIDFRAAASFQKLSKTQRYAVLFEWMHCLADAVAALHHRQMCHGAIAPSSILIDSANRIAFSEISSLSSFKKDRKMDPAEVYNYGAPENHISTRTLSAELPAPSSSRSFFGHRRGKSTEGKRSFDSSSVAGSSSSSGASVSSFNSQGTSLTAPSNSSMASLTPSKSTAVELTSPPRLHTKDFSLSPSFDAVWNKTVTSLESIPEPPDRSPPPLPTINIPRKPVGSTQEGKDQDQRPADIFSLACVFVDILSFLLKKRPIDSIKHRSTKHKNNNGKGSRVDASFHANIDKLSSWLDLLEKDAKEVDDQAMAAVPHIIRLIRLMINKNPQLRPTADVVRSRIFDALISYGELPSLHCTGSSYSEQPASPAMTFTSDGSEPRQSIGSEPRIAAFPPLPPKSPLRDASSPSSSRRPSVPTVSPPPNLPPRSSSRNNPPTWMKRYGGLNGMVGVSV